MNSELKIGMLLPQSKQYPFLDRDFMRGIKLNGLNVKFYIESIGIGADEKMIIDKMQKLSFQEDIRFFVGFFGHRNIASVYEYASSHDLFLLATDIGSNLPYAIQKKRGVYINSFGIAESSYYLGEYLAQNYKNIATSSSYYDSGYGINQAVEIGLYQNNSEFSGHYITPLNPRENEADWMQEALAPLKPEAVFAFHSGIYAEEHASYLIKNKLAQSYPFYFTSFSISDKIRQEYKDAFEGDILVVAPWSENLKNKKNTLFIEKYKAILHEKPSVFSMLGYESGLIVESLLRDSDGIPALDRLIERMEDAPEGPRGKMEFHSDTNRTRFDHYIFKMTEDETQIEAVLKNNGEFIQKIMSDSTPIAAGGWHNAYLCH